MSRVIYNILVVKLREVQLYQILFLYSFLDSAWLMAVPFGAEEILEAFVPFF